MFNTIVLPIDVAQAERGKAILDVARELGGKKARYIVTNVIEAVPAYVAAELPAGLLEQAVEDAQTELKAMAKAAGISAEIEVRTGHAPTAILDVAEDTGADLIIIASHRPGWQDYLLGSTAARVVRHAKCSVLVLR
ncbi:MAG: universal stress protein [Alphaproteobacteria bacterium]|nr:MAG: universal stress protein [Alphaproteobacteria bacterium]